MGDDMNINELITIKTLENESTNTEKHTRYTTEIKLFSCVQQGDVKKLLKELKNANSVVVTGKVSENSLMQDKYMAVSTFTLATRYAIQGGLNENTAYDFSDKAIASIDNCKNSSEVLFCIGTQIIKLTQMVKKSKSHPEQSPYVRKCILFINENLEKRITVYDLANLCNVSPNHLSQVFKEEMGVNLSSYILRKKLELSKELLIDGKNNIEICKLTGFSSPSHFITAFKREFNMTPKEYIGLAK